MTVSPVAMVRSVLADSGIAPAYGVVLPASLAADMPTGAILVRMAGGAGIGSESRVRAGESRVDVRVYGATHIEADSLHWQVYDVLKQLRPQKVMGAWLWSLGNEARGANLQEPETDWPFVLSVWRVRTGEAD